MSRNDLPILSSSHVLIVGGCGFLGHHIVQAFLSHPCCPKVSIACRSPTHNLLPGASYHQLDITSKSALETVFNQLRPTIIINTASPVANANATTCSATIITGTHLSLACAASCPSVKAYIYISSTSIVTGAPFSLLTESEATIISPGSNHHDPYTAAKATADAMVLAANDPLRLRTAVLRPCGIVGEGDAQIIPSLLRAMRQGMPRIQLGDGKSKFDFVYAGNVADACICCMEALIREHQQEEITTTTAATNHGTPSNTKTDAKVSGEAFFITNGEPVEFWAFASLVWRLAGDRTSADKITIIPMWIAFFFAWLAEWVVWIFSAGSKRPEKFNRSQMENCSLDRTFDVTKAKERLKWLPKTRLEDAAQRGVQSVLTRKSEVPKKAKNV